TAPGPRSRRGWSGSCGLPGRLRTHGRPSLPTFLAVQIAEGDRDRCILRAGDVHHVRQAAVMMPHAPHAGVPIVRHHMKPRGLAAAQREAVAIVAPPEVASGMYRGHAVSFDGGAAPLASPLARFSAARRARCSSSVGTALAARLMPSVSPSRFNAPTA